MNLSKKIAELHSGYSVYDSGVLNSTTGNIFLALNNFPEFDYLATFYKDYIINYPETNAKSTNDYRAKSKDLFFIGDRVIEKDSCKFFFVFEGSLSSIEKLSITVLSHLWLLENSDPIIQAFCGKDKWWSFHNYRGIKDKLKINREIARHSYVVDAIRLGLDEQLKNTKTSNQLKIEKNRELIYKEIILLKPKLVICVGTAAQSIVGMKYLDQNTKFHFIRFPKYHKETKAYEDLFRIMQKITLENE
jgi:hypothetical protein